MSASSAVRVATTQYRVENNIQENLSKLLGYIDAAAEGGARLVVTPEFGNHSSFYKDADEAWEAAITLDGDYLAAVKQKAAEKNIYVVFNSTLRGEQKPTVYITNFLIGADGELVGYDYKQVLMSGESMHLTRSPITGRVYDTEIGRIGMMSCLDGVPPETARILGLLGAQIITNAHNSCALDEPYAHIPARAAENHVWVLPSGKVGPICVDEMIDFVASKIEAPANIVSSHGENPILDPQGKPVERLPSLEEGIIFADIDVALADNKRWADGDLFKDRRPDLYQAVTEEPIVHEEGVTGPVECAVIQVNSYRSFQANLHRALDLAADAAVNGAQIIVLPELCGFNPEEVHRDPKQALELSEQIESSLQQLAKQYSIYIAFTRISEDDGLRHSGVLLNDEGERVGIYHQTHLTDSFKSWCKAGDNLPVWDTPLGRIAMLIGYDMVFTEPASVLARQGAEIILHPTTWRFEWEPSLILSERACENRVSIVSASRSDSDIKRGGMINALSVSKPLRAADLNPIWPVEAPHDRELHMIQRVYPERSRNNDLLGFDLQKGRRPELNSIMTEPV